MRTDMHAMERPVADAHAATMRAWQLWIALYVFGLFGPLTLLAVAPHRGGDRLDLFALYAGYVGFTSYALQLVLPARLPALTRTFGAPLLLRLHRLVGTLVLVFVALHVGILALHRPEYRSWLVWPFDDPVRAQLGWLAVLALLALLVTSWWRAKLGIAYELWRALHLSLGLLGTSAALAHLLVASWYSTFAPLRWLLVGIFVLGVASVAYLRVVRPFERLAAPYVVRDVVAERGAATSLLLEAVGHPGIRFEPGQFAWINIAGSTYSLHEHPFSFATSATQPRTPGFTIRARGDFTQSVRAIPVGSEVLLDGPHGAWTPPLPDAGFVLVVAGIGITPAMSIIRTVAAQADPRPITLLHGARSWDEITFREELQQLAARADLQLNVEWVLEQPHSDWTGAVGRIDEALLPALLPSDVDARNCFVCGPPQMIDDVLDALSQLGVPGELVYADRF